MCACYSLAKVLNMPSVSDLYVSALQIIHALNMPSVSDLYVSALQTIHALNMLSVSDLYVSALQTIHALNMPSVSDLYVSAALQTIRALNMPSVSDLYVSALQTIHALNMPSVGNLYASALQVIHALNMPSVSDLYVSALQTIHAGRCCVGPCVSLRAVGACGGGRLVTLQPSGQLMGHSVPGLRDTAVKQVGACAVQCTQCQGSGILLSNTWVRVLSSALSARAQGHCCQTGGCVLCNRHEKSVVRVQGIIFSSVQSCSVCFCPLICYTSFQAAV